jgi:hypothetical protein
MTSEVFYLKTAIIGKLILEYANKLKIKQKNKFLQLYKNGV